MSDNQNPQRVTSTGLLKLTQVEIDYLQSFLSVNDQGGYYLALYMTDGGRDNELCGEASNDIDNLVGDTGNDILKIISYRKVS